MMKNILKITAKSKISFFIFFEGCLPFYRFDKKQKPNPLKIIQV